MVFTRVPYSDLYSAPEVHELLAQSWYTPLILFGSNPPCLAFFLLLNPFSGRGFKHKMRPAGTIVPRLWAVSAALSALALGTAWAEEGVCIEGDPSCSASSVEAKIVLHNGADEELNVYVAPFRDRNRTGSFAAKASRCCSATTASNYKSQVETTGRTFS
jgi:hypothetical protein